MLFRSMFLSAAWLWAAALGAQTPTWEALLERFPDQKPPYSVDFKTCAAALTFLQTANIQALTLDENRALFGAEAVREMDSNIPPVYPLARVQRPNGGLLLFYAQQSPEGPEVGFEVWMRSYRQGKCADNQLVGRIYQLENEGMRQHQHFALDAGNLLRVQVETQTAANLLVPSNSMLTYRRHSEYKIAESGKVSLQKTKTEGVVLDYEEPNLLGLDLSDRRYNTRRWRDQKGEHEFYLVDVGAPTSSGSPAQWQIYHLRRDETTQAKTLVKETKLGAGDGCVNFSPALQELEITDLNRDQIGEVSWICEASCTRGGETELEIQIFVLDGAELYRLHAGYRHKTQTHTILNLEELAKAPVAVAGYLREACAHYFQKQLETKE